MRTIFVFCLALAACHDRSAGERCNPSQFSDNGVQGDCESGLACVYPTAPNCGVAYCCKLDDNGNIADTHPQCQADPSLTDVCGLDLSISVDASMPEDASS